jgi:cell division septum initiation protein DivIVA
MDNFIIVKRGYAPVEVDAYIAKLKDDYEQHLKEQKDRIFYLKDQLEKITNSSDSELMTSLVSAVERARVIEDSSKSIYELETKKLGLIYSKMETLLNDSTEGGQDKRLELLNLIQDCRDSLQNNIQAQQQNLSETVGGDPIKRLLSKMIDFNKIPQENSAPQKQTQDEVPQTKNFDTFEKQETPKKQVVTLNEDKTEKQADEMKPEKSKKFEGKLKPDLAEFDKFLSKTKTTHGRNFESIMFAKKDRENIPNYSQALPQNLDEKKISLAPNETGFDLKEAVNPKEDLDEIMKAFDFFNDNKKKI